MAASGGSSLLAEEPHEERPDAVVRVADLVERWAAPAIAFISIVLLAADQGGYFQQSWGWAAAGLLLPIIVWLFVSARAELGTLDRLILAAFSVFALWTGLSTVWSDAPARSLVESERSLLYLTAIAAMVLLTRRSNLQLLVVAVWAAVAVIDVYSLCTRLFPDRLGVYDPVSTYRLSEPIGYWNGLGLFTVIGSLLAVGLAARTANAALRIVAASSLTILLPVFYFTFSRASWIVLGVGVVVALLYDTRRLQLVSWLLLLAPAPALAALVAARSEGLTHAQRPLAEAVHDGHRLALALLVLLPVTAGCAVLGIWLERRVHVAQRVRRSYAAVLVGAVVVVLTVGFVHVGGPVRAVERAYDSFKSPPAQTGTNLNERLLDLSSNGRVELWHVAWRDYEGHELWGSGAGTFDRYWFRDRETNFNARDAHSLYIETLAELGPVGLAALLVGLIAPLLAAVRVRREPLAPLLLSAYVAFLVHAGVDWDFELPGVSLAGLFSGVALIVLSRGVRPRTVSGTTRAVAGTVAVALLGFALWGLIGNSALAASKDARIHRNPVKAEREARRAEQLMPWSSEPWVALGFAESARGDLQGAAASFRRAIAKDGGDWALWFDLASVTRGAERKRAIARGLALNPLSFELQGLRSRSG